MIPQISDDLLGDRSQYQPLKHAIDTIAEVCDGAVEHDEVGFNAPDAPLGHLLAFLPLALWPPEALHQAWVLLRKYQRQLAFAGIAYADLPEPPCLASEQTGGTRSIALLDTGAFLVLFPAQARLERAFGRIPGAEKHTTPARHFLIQPVPGAGAAVLSFAQRYGFHLAPGVTERARLLAYQVVLEEDGASFGVYFPRDEDLNNEIKTVPCRSFSYTPRFRWLIPTNLVSAQCLHAFLVRHPEFQLTREVALRLQQAADATTPVPAPVPTRREQRSLRRGGL